MSKADSNAVRNFTLIPEEWRTMVVSGAREFRGTSRNPETRELNKLVDLIFTDVESGTTVHQNYSLDKPSYLASVLEAINPGGSADLLDSIDWATDDVDAIMGIEIEVKVYHQQFPENSGRYQNRIGNVRSIGSDIGAQAADDEADELPF